MGVFTNELSTLYDAHVRGATPALAPLRIQYPDFAVWQRTRLDDEVLDAQLAYWREELGGLPPVLELPTDRPRPAVRSGRGARHAFPIAPETLSALRDVGRTHNATLFMTVLAAFKLLLARYSGSADIAVGTPIAGRTRAELEGLIGFFVNTLVLRSDLSGAPSFAEVVQRVREVALGAYAHQDVPFEKLVEELQPTRSLSHTPLFQVMFSLDRVDSDDRLELSGLELAPFRLSPDVAKFDLTLNVVEDGHAAVAVVEYDTDLFDASTIERLTTHFANLLEAIAAAGGAERPVHELDILEDAEHHRLVTELNETAADYPKDRTVHELFQGRAEASPEAVAVVCGDEELSYGDLNTSANRLAHHLRDLGVGPETIVAVCLGRRTELVVSLLAVLKAGGAYVPLDPDYPQDRLAYMIEDSGAAVVVTDSEAKTRLGEVGVPALLLDEARDVLSERPDTEPEVATTPENLAYVIYTSGSTGRPKGVAVRHAGLTNLVTWHDDTYSVTPNDRGALVAPLGFDASVWELWPYLTCGASVALPPDEIRLSPAELCRWLDQRSVSITFLPTALVHEVLADGHEPTGPKTILTGGDQLRMRPSQDAAFELVNHYGPTEGTVVATALPVAPGDDGPVPIGHPIANTRTYVLDPYGNPAPQGVAGELHIGGAGLARGYLGRPALTAERFVPDPFSEAPGARLYRTGDRVRITSDGTIDFLGRVDHQVKIRGFRIEPGEIQATLLTHPAVKDVVVVPRDERLVAYVVADGHVPATTELRAHLTATLPDYMVPAAFVTLDELPLTPNGKLDRDALPSPELEAAYTAPRTPIEEILAGIWAEVLGLERVGVHDDFFELGGHSLVATKVVARVRDALDVELPVRALFESPTVAALAEATTAGARAETPPIQPADRGRELPLSFAQQRLWFIDQFEPGRSEYSIRSAMRLKGDLDRAALIGALSDVVARHESLRTAFRTVEGRPLQVIDPAAELAIGHVDLSHLPEAERAAEARRVAAAEAARPFDLTANPLFRAALIELAPDDHVLVVTMHHIVSDGWSMTLFTNELSALYDARVTGTEPNLRPLRIQYADFAQWQRSWLDGDVMDAQLDYWREQLAGLPPVLELPTDRPRPAARSGRGARHRFGIAPGTLAALEDLGRTNNATLFMTLLAAFKLLLSRYSGSADIAVGTPIAGRTRAELEDLIGFFVNTLVLRSDLSGDPTFTELLARVREVALGAYAHQDVPFEKLVEELQPARSLSHTPLFQVMFSLERVGSGDRPALGGLELAPFALPSDAAKFDLTFNVVEDGNAAAGLVEYDTDLFDASTIERLTTHFANLLEAIVAAGGAGRPVSELDVLDDAERHFLLAELNETAAGYPKDRTVHELFQARAKASPAAVAVVCGDEELTYAELDASANRLAHHLRERGVASETIVGVCLGRGTELVVALLAVLKAGGAYVPLDPDYPSDRLTYMLEDSGAAVVVTDSDTRELLGEVGVPVVLFDEERDVLAARPDTDPEIGAGPENLAYVIYTSGSTGRPKGVAVRHAGLTNLVAWHDDTYGVTSADRASLVAPIGFDASVWELWPYLACGASVALPPDEVRHSPAELCRWLEEHGVSIAFLPTALVHEVLAHGHELTGPKTILTGGDQLRMRPAEDAAFELVNHYGPTEGTVVATALPVAPGDDGPVPIGHPIANTRSYVLDAHGNPTPQGVAGELYIGGAGLARGYLGRPGLTGERFVPDPFSGTPGARLYRTGDRVRIASDGTIDFLGRVDHQVKIRGFRIEPGEIQATLLTHRSIRDAVVIARAEGGSDARLVAYLVADGDPPATTELRAHLTETLPDYMVPAAFVTLDDLPLTPNGKLDRDALPRPEIEAVYTAPRTPTEEILVGIWADVLGVERVGVHDDFFELGGHSLVATQVVSRIRDALDVELPVRALFESPTVAELAEATVGGVRAEAPPIEPAGRDGELPLSFAQQRLWFIDQLEPGGSEYNVPSAVRLKGDLDQAALERALGAIVSRHESLRTTFRTVEGRPVQVINAAGAAAIERIELAHLEESERESEARRIAAGQAGRPFDPSAGPLLRTALIELAPDDHILVLTMHHIVSDGWSMAIFMGELSALYDAYVTGTEANLPPLEIQYADFAVWQRGWLDGDVLEAQLAYWREHLAGLPPLLELPTDRPRPEVRTGRGARHGFVLAADTVAALRDLGRTHNATLFMTMLAAFKLLLARYSGSADITVGTPIAGRTRAELEGLIGFFVNTLVLRSDLSGDPTFAELVARVREVALGAYAHQDVPFEKLVEELQPVRSLSHTPLFQVMFALDRVDSDDRLELTGLELQPFRISSDAAKFDLMFNVADDGRTAGGVVEYDADLFDASTIERFTAHFANLLDAIAAGGAEKRVSEFDVLDAAERHRLVADVNETAAEYPSDRAAHELFEARAKTTPDAVALFCGDDELTYGELNAAANGLAHHLRDLGVNRETLVGVCLDRSADLVVSLLAVLKSGGAYLPLDPDYPPDRLAFMLRDSGAGVVVTDSQTRPSLGDLDATVVLLDETKDELATRPDSDPEAVTTPDDLAYVIYTSGSTGIPKGVGVAHGPFATHCLRARDHHALTPDDRVLVFSSFSFDVSLEQLFSPLVTGASAVVRDDVWDPARLATEIERFGLTVTDLPTAYWHELLGDAAVTERLAASPSLRLVVAGGEAMAPGRVRPWIEAAGDRIPLLNSYGPTETVITATSHRVTGKDVASERPLPIGRPLANTTVYVLDRHGNPAPQGVPGELYIGGATLARGYLGRAGLTAERFVPDPFSKVPGARLYRSGDRARITAEGTIEFLGRVDHQVKIRGFRIEPGEIEAALRTHDAVRDAVVVPREGRLVAYLVAHGDAPTTTELRAHLTETLPDYMVPAYFVFLDAIPLTPNGKVDRNALPAPEGRPELDAAYAAPGTETEAILAKIWAEVLGLESVGVHDNFFELGGDSILSIQIVARANAAGLGLSPKDIFQNQSVAALATVAGVKGGVVAEQGTVSGDVPLTPIQRWFFELELDDEDHFNQAMILDATGADAAKLGVALKALVTHHDALRLRFDRTGAGVVQTNAASDDHDVYEVVDLKALDRTAQRRALYDGTAKLQASLDISEGPIVRAAYFDLGDEARLFVGIHHLAVDGVSWRVLLEDLDTAYGQLERGEAIELPPKTTSFRQWAERLVEHANGPALDSELDHWLSIANRDVATLPVDHPEGSNVAGDVGTVSVALTEDETRALLQDVPAAYQTQINDVLLAALGRALTAWAGRSGILVDLEGHGREDLFDDVDLTRTVGWFTSMFPVLLDLADPDDPRATITAVKEGLRAIPGRGIGYGLLRYLRERDDAARLRDLPAAQISFNYLGQFDGASKDSGLFGRAPEAIGDVHSPEMRRPHQLDVNGVVSGDCLQVAWIYSPNLHDRATIEELAAGFVAALRALIDHCTSEDVGGWTPSDFPLAELDQDDLDALVQKLELEH
nr:condensation domain-containing protein [uncultured bacterium]